MCVGGGGRGGAGGSGLGRRKDTVGHIVCGNQTLKIHVFEVRHLPVAEDSLL